MFDVFAVSRTIIWYNGGRHTEIESLFEPVSLLPNQFLDPGWEVLAEVIQFELSIVLPKSCHTPCVLRASCVHRLVQVFSHSVGPPRMGVILLLRRGEGGGRVEDGH